MGLLGPRVGSAFDRFGARPLVIPGSIGVVIALTLLSQVGETTPYALILGSHVLMMVSLAALFTPVFTISLGALPHHLYSHGSSLLGTTQQVAAAIGTAVSVTVLTSRTNIAAGRRRDAVRRVRRRSPVGLRGGRHHLRRCRGAGAPAAGPRGRPRRRTGRRRRRGGATGRGLTDSRGR